MFESITAPNRRENATLADGKNILQKLINQGISSNPTLYATQQGGIQAGFVPAFPNQDTSGPTQPEFPIAGGSLTVGDFADPPTPVPDDQPIDLGVWVSESGDGQGNMCGIADILRWLAAGGSLAASVGR